MHSAKIKSQSRNSAAQTRTSKLKIKATLKHGGMTWNVMLISVLNAISNLRTSQLTNFTKISTPCLDDHQIKVEDMVTVGELSETCTRFVLKCCYLARIGRCDLLWVRSVTKMEQSLRPKACKTYKLHSSYSKLLAVLSCGKQSNGLQVGFIPGCGLCRTSFRFQAHVRRCSVSAKQTVVCQSGTESEPVPLDAD